MKGKSSLQRQEYLIQRELLRRRASTSLLAFIMWMRDDYEVNWHHRVLCMYLDKVVSGEIKRLLVEMPPRHGKSEIVSRHFPAYYLGRFPNKEVMCASYNQDLASAMNRDVQRIIDSQKYREVFPNTTLAGDNEIYTEGQTTYVRTLEQFDIVGHRGKYVGAGVGGGLTGKGADLLNIDDPHKDYEEAMSATMRNKVTNWYDAVAETRLSKGAPVIITMTRWHEGDLVGYNLDHAKKDENADQWVELRLPAIKDEEDLPGDKRKIGEALWPERFPVDRLLKIKAKNPLIYNALYDQRPTMKEGNGFKRHWFKYYKAQPQHYDEEILSVDCAFKGLDTSDFVAIQHWGRIGAICYLINEWHAKLDFPATIKQILSVKATCPSVFRILVEDKANGPAVMDMLKSKIFGLTPFDPKTSKEARVSAVSPSVEGGNVFIPDPEYYPWVKEYITELCAFPNAKNDDRVDATTQALLHFNGSGSDYLEKLLGNS